jgi:uncharacterized protein with ATP-grasp and redox domains
MYKRCIDCFRSGFDRLTKRFPLDEEKNREFQDFFNDLMKSEFCCSSPEIQRELHQKLYALLGIADPYALVKMQSNWTALDLYWTWKPEVLIAPDPFAIALKLAVAGNIIDFGAQSHFDLNKTIDYVMQHGFAHDDSALLKNKLSRAQKVLYLGDNAGEVVFDKLLIEMMMHQNVYFAVRGGPIINDVTLQDAKEVEMGLSADVITSGYNAPATVLEKSSDHFRSHFETADVIISKGQGNFESLSPSRDPRIFFLLVVKCDVIAEMVGYPIGSALVYNFKKQKK